MIDSAIQFTSSLDGTRIALRSTGAGRPAIIRMPTLFSHLEIELQTYRRHLHERLAERHQFIRYDGRGQGLSDRDPAVLSFASAIDDLEAVIDFLQLERVVLYAIAHAGPIAIAFAALHPEKVSHLVLQNSFVRHSDYFHTAMMEALMPLADKDWTLFTMIVAQARFVWGGGGYAKESGRLLKESMTPDFFRRLLSVQKEFDAEEYLATISTPTLVLYRPNGTILESSASSYLAAHMPGARLVILPEEATDYSMDNSIDEIVSFVGWEQTSSAPNPPIASGPSPGISLSRRELQVLRLLVEGCRNQDIARELQLSNHTVERHLTNIYSKLGVGTRVEAVTYAIRQGLA